MKKHLGFTLIEISIVLVILGLLVGGVFLGKSVMDAAALQRFVGDLRQFDVMHSQFMDKYKQVPGDTTFFPITGYPNPRIGQNDGKVLDDNFMYGLDYFNYEFSHYWHHMHLAGISSQDYLTDASTGVRAGVHLPKTSFAGVGPSIYTWPYNGSSMLNSTDWMLFFAIADFSRSTSDVLWDGTGAKGFVSPTVAMSIDQKIDDGRAYVSASAKSYGLANTEDRMTWDSMDTDSCYSAADATGAAFNIAAGEKKVCFLFIRIGSLGGGKNH